MSFDHMDKYEQNAALLKSIAAKDKRIAELEADLVAVEGSRAAWQSDIGAYQREFRNLKKKLAAAQATIARLVGVLEKFNHCDCGGTGRFGEHWSGCATIMVKEALTAAKPKQEG